MGSFTNFGKQLFCDSQPIGDMLDEWTAKRTAELLNDRERLVETCHQQKLQIARLEKYDPNSMVRPKPENQDTLPPRSSPED